jgi:hypothetical protein
MKIRKVTDYRAPGSMILVEMLSPEEAAGSHLATAGKSTQGRIIDIGPALRTEIDKYGFAVGQRVLLQGTNVPVPKFPGGDSRELVVVDPHTIKCILVEECCGGGKCKSL